MFLTKTTGYGMRFWRWSVALRWRRGGFSWKWALPRAASILGPALLLGCLVGTQPAVYGWPDFVGLLRHNEVVVGQPRTTEFLARRAYGRFSLRRCGQRSARSGGSSAGWGSSWILAFTWAWGCFCSCGLGSALAVAEGYAMGWIPGPGCADSSGNVLLITVGLYLVYNLTFVQHQGRYLFTALPALALAGALGLNRLAEKRLAVVTASLLLVLLIGIGLVGLLLGDVPYATLILIGVAAAGVLAAGLVPARYVPLLGGAVLMGLVALDFLCLFGFIVPLLG